MIMEGEREEIDLILNHPAYKGTLTQDLLWARIHFENLKHEFRRLFGKDDDDGYGGKGTARFA